MSKFEESSFKKDFSGALLIGFLAGLLALIVVKNLNIPIPFWLTLVLFPILCISGIFVGRFLGKKIPIMYKFVKFGEAGGLNWLVDFGILNLLIMFTGISSGLTYSIFKGASFLGATANSYGWNKLWVFESTSKDTKGELIRFIVSTLLGLGVNVTIASVIVIFGPKMVELDPKVWANIAAAIGSLLAMAWNFLMYKFWVFK